jgi:hypothetical protein
LNFEDAPWLTITGAQVDIRHHGDDLTGSHVPKSREKRFDYNAVKAEEYKRYIAHKQRIKKESADLCGIASPRAIVAYEDPLNVPKRQSVKKFLSVDIQRDHSNVDTETVEERVSRRVSPCNLAEQTAQAASKMTLMTNTITTEKAITRTSQHLQTGMDEVARAKGLGMISSMVKDM